MNKHIVWVIGALGVSMGAQADVSVSNGPLPGSFLAISAANVTSGTFYPDTTALVPNVAARPGDAVQGFVTSGNWLAGGPSHGGAATLLLPTGTTAVSFLWGSPDGTPSDIINTLTVNVSGGPSESFTVGQANIVVTNGDQQQAFYRTFSTDVGTITSLSFASNINAFEVSNVTVVPEPEAYGLALAGMGVVAFAMRRRRQA
jgi:hypothetical protein